MALIAPTVETIGDEALTNSIIDRSITEIQDNMITRIGQYALTGCTNLKKLAFGSLTELAYRCFAGLSALEHLELYQPVSFEMMQCQNTALKALILRSNTMSSLNNTNAFQNTPIASGTGYIYVPRALVDSYKTASGWSTYANQIRAIEDYPEVCDPYSWEAVSYHIENGTYKDVYKIGDCVPVDLGSEGVINMQIAAFDADTLADGSGTAAISWVAKELLATKRKMCATYDTSTGWSGSNLRIEVNNVILPLFPQNVSEQIVTVTKIQEFMNASYKEEEQTSEDGLWIPSNVEMKGIYSRLFSSAESRIKHPSGVDTAGEYFLRDLYNASYYFTVNPEGAYDYSPPNGAMYVCLGFCTGKTPT